MCCDAVKKIPAAVQRTIEGSSSKAALTFSIRPPAAGITAIAPFRNESSRAIAEPNAIFDPSGDHTGPVSAPAWVTSARTLPSATDTIEMSAVPLLALAELTR